MKKITAINLLFIVLTLAAYQARAGQPATPTNPIMFVTQVPVPQDFVTIGAVFGNHQSGVDVCARGGDLMIRYPDGTLKNLTAAAGFGVADSFQGANSIAVRDPAIHWSGKKALFSMVIGSPSKQYDYSFNGVWQIYEITGFGQNETPVITKVPNQPAFNNISPLYGTDERIVFTSDRPRNGAAHLYPPRDEYEFAPVVTGIWSMNPADGNLFLVSHDPSGSFNPTIDSFGRLIFTRWDHLQRDQEADADAESKTGPVYGTVNFPDETAAAVALPRQEEVFPEPRPSRTDLLQGTNLVGHRFNQFFPWMVNEDGTEQETLNHVGRHELFNYFEPSFNDDPNLVYFNPPSDRVNKNKLDNMLQIREDPTHSGLYYGVDTPEFSTHASGQILTLNGPKGINPDQMTVQYVTDRSTAGYTADGAAPDPNHSGHYRNPLPLTDGLLLAVHAPETRAENNDGTTTAPKTRYDFKIKTMVASGATMVAGVSLTGGIKKTVSYWTPDVLVNYSGPLWELSPVEVVARAKPAKTDPTIPGPEQAVFNEESVDMAAFKSYMTSNNLALVISRDLTTRDRADKQQPFNLRVTGTTTQDVSTGGKVYDISFLQFFQADMIRAFKGGGDTIRPGRRVLATPMHDDAGKNPVAAGAPAGSVQIGTDGSMAAFVPANRAMTWQTTAANGTPVVRERYWLSFQPGEIRTCTSCHGINTADQANKAVPQNKPEALRTLIKFWKNGSPTPPTPAGPVFSSGATAQPSNTTPGQNVSFSATATGATALTYTWDFADATTAQSGASVTHAFVAAGTYNVAVKVVDTNGKSAQSKVQVTVATGGVVDPNPNPNPNPNPTPAAGELSVKRAQLKLNFAETGKDAFTLTGTVTLPSTFNPSGKSATIKLGTFSAGATLNGKGNDVVIQLLPAQKKDLKKADALITWNVTVTMKSQSMFSSLKDLGFTNGDLVPAVKVALPVTLECDGSVFKANVSLSYSSKKGKAGVGVLK